MNEGARRRVPVVTLVILAACLIAAAALTAYPDLAMSLGFRSDRPSGRDALTSLFLHANLVHLFGNMFFLAVVGGALEMATGSVRFALVFFLSGLFGVVAHYVMTRHGANPAPLLGASGAIAGCAGYYTVRYASLRIAVAPGLTLSTLAVTALWVLLQAVGAFVHIGESVGGTAFWAHLGGFAAGVIMCLVFKSPDVAQAELSRERMRLMAHRGPRAVAELARRHLKEHPDDLGARRELADALQKLGEAKQEIAARTELLSRETGLDRADDLRRLGELGAWAGLNPATRLKEAQRAADTDPALAEGLMRSVLDDANALPHHSDALLALADLSRERDPEAHTMWTGRLLREYPLSAATQVARKRGWCP